jgi:uncharacterized protein
MKDISYELQMIREYGRDILASDKFREARGQIHHYRTTVASHSVSTAYAGIRMCLFLKRIGIKVDTRMVVRTALLHDLGMVGRNELYRSNYECCFRHPKESAAISRQICSDIDEKSLAAIKSHMWPLSVHMPGTKEAFVLCMADKIASVKDLVKMK